jgi:hypothetical protein
MPLLLPRKPLLTLQLLQLQDNNSFPNRKYSAAFIIDGCGFFLLFK